MSSTIANATSLVRAHRLISNHAKTIVFVTTLLRAREMVMASALRQVGWKVVLIFEDRTPFKPEGTFDVIFRVNGGPQALNFAKQLQPRICHIFAGAIDDTVSSFCIDKPSPIIIDLNDIFAPSLLNHCEERFEPTRECLRLADALCARDLQAKFAERLDGWTLPKNVVLFPEYPWQRDAVDHPQPKLDRDELHVVSVGTICLETQGHFDSGHLRLAELFAEQHIHLHLFPHWGYRNGGRPHGNSVEEDFADFFVLQESTGYVHVHNSLALPELRRVLPSYDFGIISGGKEAFGQIYGLLKPPYIQACYSGRISDFIAAR
ncbi:MAG: hypothetical protein O3C21_09975, partial [Verrucomicrobia bacterium]|nr:hypothetical protein [Verrucomicrobiota bacterium]